MTTDAYIKDRLDDQITWYSNQSKSNQKYYKRLKIIEIVIASFIPFFAGVGIQLKYYSITIGILGLIVAISAGVIVLYKYHENWIKYRTTCEMLKHEKYLFLTKCAPYNLEDAFCLLVSRVEILISKENTQWSEYSVNTKNIEK
jgi:hypothetical protein|tara:strand:+ start:117 stop:548 length:432 start_codon:yes stop_codon:yes gene_type:complete